MKTTVKKYLSQNVFDAAHDRLRYIFAHFPKVYVAFSGGKDSGVLLNMALQVANEVGRLPLDVLVVDLEAQYDHTVQFVQRMANRPDVRFHWICLPIKLRNAVSQYQPHWLCWDTDNKDCWVRSLPDHPGVISDPATLPFFRKGMEFEEFIIEYGNWFSGGVPTATLVGIRSDESLNRYRTIKHATKSTFEGKQWSTQHTPQLYAFYPMYDWHTKDIWRANGKCGWDYNHIYDLMYLADVPLSKQRLCQPFGDDQRQGLYLFKILEPDTWAKIVGRVAGANFGNRYSEYNKTALGDFRVNLPAGYTYETYSKFLLDTMPPYLQEHYQQKITKFLEWWKKKGVDPIPDFANNYDEAKKTAPSWRRICKVLLKNDYWCRGLSFSMTKRDMEKQQALFRKYLVSKH